MGNAGLGVSLGARTLRAVAVRRKGEAWIVTRAVAGPARGGDPADAGAWLRREGLKGAPATLGLTGKDVIIRYNQVPPVPEWRLRNLMKYEVAEVSGQSGGAVSADYRKLSLPDPDGTRSEDTVLVALARNVYLQPLLDAAASAGLSVAGGCPHSVALFNAFAVNATYREDETCLLVHVGGAGMDLAIERGGELVFARNVSPGGQAFTDAIAQAFATTPAKAETLKRSKADVTPRGQARYPDSTAEKIANALMGPAGQVAALIQSTLMICRAQTKLPDLKVDRVWLAGAGASLKGLDAYLQQAMGVPVARFDPFEACDLSGLPEDERSALQAAPHEFAVALGLAQTPLAPAAFRLEVLPEAVRRKREFATRGVFAVAAGVVAMAALGVLYVSRKAAAEEISKQRGALRAAETAASKRDEALKGQVVRVQEEREKHRRLAEIAAPGALLADAMHVLTSNLPPEVFLDTVTLEVEDKTAVFPHLHPAARRGTYTSTDKQRTVRAAKVVVVARISQGARQNEIYGAYVGACERNDRGLFVRARKVLSAGQFELEMYAGVALRPAAAEAGSGLTVLRDAALVDEDPSREGYEAIAGTTTEGTRVVLSLRGDAADAWRLEFQDDAIRQLRARAASAPAPEAGAPGG